MRSWRAAAALLVLLLAAPAEPSRVLSGSSDSSGSPDSSGSSGSSESSTRATNRKSSSSGRSAENEDPTSDGADSSGNTRDHLCAGRGQQQFCEDDFAAGARKCPKACRPGRCDSVSGTSRHSGAIRSGVYDFVYIQDDEICVRSCDGKGACVDWETHKGERFCKAIRCERASLDGCHGSEDFDAPTCRDCMWLFPNACKADAYDSSGSVDRSFEEDDGGGDRFRAYILRPWDEGWGAAGRNSTGGGGRNIRGVTVRTVLVNGTVVAEENVTAIPPT